MAPDQEIREHRSRTYANDGVNESLESVRDEALAAIAADCIAFMSAMPDTSVVHFGETTKKIHDAGWVRWGALADLKVIDPIDHKWKTGPFKTERHRHVSFTLQYDMVIKSRDDGQQVFTIPDGLLDLNGTRAAITAGYANHRT